MILDYAKQLRNPSGGGLSSLSEDLTPTLGGNLIINGYDIPGFARDAEVAAKQNSLVSGSTIKTVNGTSILGSGNISIASGGTLGDLGITATSTELNYCDGLLANAQAQLNGKLNTITDVSLNGWGDSLGIQVSGMAAWSFGYPSSNLGELIPTNMTTKNLGRNNTNNAWSNLYIQNNPTVISDQREKIIEGESLGLEFLTELSAVKYRLKNGKSGLLFDEDGNEYQHVEEGQRHHHGLLAQEVKAAMDKLNFDFGGWVLEDMNDPLSNQSLRYEQFVSPLIKAVQELNAKCIELQSEIDLLKGV